MSEIVIQISDMDAQSPRLKALILDRIGQGVTGAAWTPTDFLDLGGRDAVDKTLQRLVKWGELRRIDRGLYDRPLLNSLTQQQSAPDPRAVIDAVARRDQIRGNLAITFKHTAASKLHWAGRPAMRVVQALHWLRDTMPGDDDGQWHQRLASLLADPVHGADLRDDLADGMTTLPSWMQDMLRPLIADEESGA
jgi:hypothetical protein